MKEIKNNSDFQNVITGKKPVLLDFYADWCGPCQTLLPIVESLANKYESEYSIVKVNVDQNPELAQKFSVRSIPALFFIQNGEVVEMMNGVQPESILEGKIQKHLAVKA